MARTLSGRFASIGSASPDRPHSVDEEQLLALPFPGPDDVPNPPAALHAKNELVGLLDALLAHKDELLTSPRALTPYTQRADELVFDYYGLTPEERTLVMDGIQKIIPSMQPRADVLTPLMRESDQSARDVYTRTLLAGLREWMRPGVAVAARLLEPDKRPVNLSITHNFSLPSRRL